MLHHTHERSTLEEAGTLLLAAADPFDPSAAAARAARLPRKASRQAARLLPLLRAWPRWSRELSGRHSTVPSLVSLLIVTLCPRYPSLRAGVKSEPSSISSISHRGPLGCPGQLLGSSPRGHDTHNWHRGQMCASVSPGKTSLSPVRLIVDTVDGWVTLRPAINSISISDMLFP